MEYNLVEKKQSQLWIMEEHKNVSTHDGNR